MFFSREKEEVPKSVDVKQREEEFDLKLNEKHVAIKGSAFQLVSRANKDSLKVEY